MDCLRQHPLLALALCLALVGVPVQFARAQSSCKAPSQDCVVVGKLGISVALGAGKRTNPVQGEADIPLVVIPQISYYGKRFFLENLELGFTLHESDANTFNLIATPGYDRVFFYRDDLQNFFVFSAGDGAASVPPGQESLVRKEFELHPRRTTYLAGPEWLFDYGRVSGQVDALYEATGEHGGYEVRAAVAVPVLRNVGSLVVNAGVTWKSAELVGYYYGITDFYEPGAALNPFVKVGYTRQLSERWSLNAFAHYEYLDSAIADSPIVAEHSVLTVFAGVVFKIL